MGTRFFVVHRVKEQLMPVLQNSSSFLSPGAEMTKRHGIIHLQGWIIRRKLQLHCITPAPRTLSTILILYAAKPHGDNRRYVDNEQGSVMQIFLGRFNINMVSFQHKNSYYEDETVVRLWHLYNGNSYLARWHFYIEWTHWRFDNCSLTVNWLVKICVSFPLSSHSNHEW